MVYIYTVTYLSYTEFLKSFVPEVVSLVDKKLCYMWCTSVGVFAIGVFDFSLYLSYIEVNRMGCLTKYVADNQVGG